MAYVYMVQIYDILCPKKKPQRPFCENAWKRAASTTPYNHPFLSHESQSWVLSNYNNN